MTPGKIKGIGGWLILPIAIFIVNILLYLANLISPLGRFYIILDLIIIVLTGYTLFLIFKKDKLAPKLAIMTLWVSFLVNLIYAIEDISIEGTIVTIFIFLIGTVILTVYFIKSKRVKNTFVK